MSYPASVSTVTVTGTWTYSDGSGLIPTGTVTFVPNTVLQDATDSRIIGIKPLVATLDVAGHISVTLMNTSDADLQPAGWAYTVTEIIAGNQRQYDIFVTGGTVDLSTLAPVSSTTQFGYVLTTAVGAVGGVASLDGTGNVPLAQLGNAPSGGGTASSTVVTETAYGQASTAGVATPYSRGDHSHGSPSLASTSPTTSAVGDSAVVGTGTTPARSDHTHGREAFGTVTAQTSYGSSSGNGSAATLSHSDHTHGTPALTANTPTTSAVGDSAVVGVGTAPARDDHKHAREAFGSVTAQTSYGAASGNGSAATLAHSDHTHGTPSLTSNAPTTSAVGDAASAGSGSLPAKDDHRHGREAFAAPTGQAQSTGTTGSAATLVHSDHAHPLDTWMHLDHGALAWTFDPAMINGQTITSPVAGTVYVAKLMIPVGVTVTSIWMHVVTAGVGLTSSQCLAALFDGSKNLLQTTADQATAWGTTGLKQMTISSQALSAGTCYVGVFQNFATSAARFHAGSNGIAAVNFNLAAASSRFATDSTNTGRTTSMPSALGTLAASSQSPWVALS